jgi:hypothetical protein
MNDDLKNAIYDILVEEAGAPDEQRQAFMQSGWPDKPACEIDSHLGPETFLVLSGNVVELCTYWQNLTKVNRAIIQKTNARLAEVMEGLKS